MKTQLIINNNTAFITSDEEITSINWIYDSAVGNYFKADRFTTIQIKELNLGSYYKKIIAGIEGLPKIDWNDLEEEFGWVDVEKLAEKAIQNHNVVIGGYGGSGWKFGRDMFMQGYTLNEKKFSLEDINFLKWIYDRLERFGDKPKDYEMIKLQKFIQSLQQTKVFAIEVEMEEKHFRIVKDVNGIPYDHEYTIEPKITNNSIKILRKL